MTDATATGIRDPRVQTVLDNGTPRFIAQGVDPNELPYIARGVLAWTDWAPAWSAAAEGHAAHATAAASAAHQITAREAFTRAALYFHFGKFLLVQEPETAARLNQRLLACYAEAMRRFNPPLERVEIPYAGATLVGNLRRPAGVERPPVAILLPGLDSTKEEYHRTAAACAARGVATLALDGPGQGETAWRLPIEPQYERAVAAAIDVLETRSDVDARRVAVSGMSLGGYYAPRAAAFEPRLKACVANCGPFEMESGWEGLPPLSQEAFRHRAFAQDLATARVIALKMDLSAVAQRVRCPILVLHGARDVLFPASAAEQLAAAVSGPCDLVIEPHGNHCCFNVAWRARPLMADWLADKLAA